MEKSAWKKTALAAGMCMFAAAAYAEEHPEIPAWSEGAELVNIAGSDHKIDTFSGLVYSQPFGMRTIQPLKMTLMVPRSSEKKPAILYLPGGAFVGADHERFVSLRTALAQAGFVVASAEYRVLPNPFPAQLEDGKAAVRYLRAHAEQFEIDPDRIGILGESAGGYLVNMMGAVNGEKGWDKGDNLEYSSDVQAVVSLFGISDLTRIAEGFSDDQIKGHESPVSPESTLIYGISGRTDINASVISDREKALSASALGHIDGSEPPFLLMHGTEDTIVSPMQSKHLYEALKEKNADVRYILVNGAKHADLPWFQKPVADIITDWFKSKLGTPSAGEDPQ